MASSPNHVPTTPDAQATVALSGTPKRFADASCAPPFWSQGPHCLHASPGAAHCWNLQCWADMPFVAAAGAAAAAFELQCAISIMLCFSRLECAAGVSTGGRRGDNIVCSGVLSRFRPQPCKIYPSKSARCSLRSLLVALLQLLLEH